MHTYPITMGNDKTGDNLINPITTLKITINKVNADFNSTHYLLSVYSLIQFYIGIYAFKQLQITYSFVEYCLFAKQFTMPLVAM